MRHFSIRPGRLIKGLLVSLASIFFVLLIVGLWALGTGRATETARVEFLSRLQQECEVGGEFSSFTLGVFPPELHITDLVVHQPGGSELISVDEAIINLAVLPLFYGRVQLAKVALLRPKATLEIEDGKIRNLPSCLEPKPEKEAPTKVTVPIALGVSDLQIEQGFFRVVIPDQLDARFDAIGVHVSPGRSGGTDLAFGVDEGQLHYLEKDIKLDRVRLLAHVAGLLTNPRAISVEQVELMFKGVELVASGSVDLLGPVYEGQVDLDAPIEVAREFFDGLPKMGGRVSLKSSVSGTAVDPRATGHLLVDGGWIDEYRMADRFSLDFRASKERLDFKKLVADVGSGKVVGEGHILLDDHLGLELALDTESLSLGRVLDAVGVNGAWTDFIGDGHITCTGTLLDPMSIGGVVDMNISDFHVFDGSYSRPEIRMKGVGFVPEHVTLALGPSHTVGDWSADPDGIWFRNQRVSSGSSFGNADVRVHFEDVNGLYVKADLPLFDFADLDGKIAGVGFGGRGNVSAEIAGPYYDIRADGSLELADVRVGDTPFGNARSTVHWHDDTILDFEGVEAKLGQSSYGGQVRVSIGTPTTLDVSGKIHRGRIEDLLVPFGLRGADYGNPKGDVVFGNFDLQGPVDRLTGPLNLAAENVEILDEKAEAARFIGRMEEGTIVADEMELDKRGARISGSGRWNPGSGEVAVFAFARGLTLQKIDFVRAAHDGLDGELALRIEAQGNVRGLTGTVSASLQNLHLGALPLEPGQMFGKIRGRTVQISGTLLGQALFVNGEIDLADRLPYRAKLQLNEYDVPQLVSAALGHNDWRGLVIGHAELNGRLGDWSSSEGSLSIERARFGAGNVELETVGASRFTLERGVLETRRLVLSGARTRMTIAGRVGGLNDFKVQGRLDLSLIETLFNPVERSGGVLNVNAVVRGRADRLDLVGTGRVERGVLQWRGLPSRLTAATGRLTFSQSSVLIDDLQGRYAGGKVSAKGQVILDGLSPSNIVLDMRLEEVRPRFLQAGYDLSGIIDGKLKLQGSPEKLLLRGRMNVQQGRYGPKFDWSKLVNDPSKRLVVDVYDPGSEVLTLDINVHLDPLARVKNESSDVEVSGDLRLVGTNERMGLLGSLGLQRGRVGFLGRAYEIRGGSVDFTERYQIQPRYDLNLRARACDAMIDVNVSGTLDAFQTAYLANPEMDETSIVSCLKFGVKLEDTGVIAGGQSGPNASALRSTAGAQQMAGLGMEALWRLSGVDQQVRRVVPVDQIEVTTEYSARLRVYEPRLVVGKDLGFVQLQASTPLVPGVFSDEFSQSAAAKFRLAPDLSLEVSWQYSQFIPAVGDLGLDIKRRWEW